MRKWLSLLVLCALASSAFAGGYRTHRMSDGSVLSFKHHEVNPIGLVPVDSWDADKVYRVPVILISFSDCDFSWENPKQFYDDLFNKQGHNLGKGPGCVADYFRDQSHGLFNIQFDIIGPVKLKSKQKSGSYNYGTSQFYEAVKTVDSQVDFADFDWDGEGRIPAVIFIYAGYGGNESASVADGCINPNTGYFGRAVDDGARRFSYYSASAELWSNNTSCGIGTICHEYCHTMGIPDLYPTNNDSPEYSVVDEWDIMDGGCFSDDGWCPPNLSIHEREILKWQSPTDLTVSVHITDMPPFDKGGMAYRIVNEAYPSEYYLLENRQQTGWDLMLPGHGLLVSHVDYNETIWSYVTVNNDPSHHRFDYFHADGHDFNYYESLYGRKNVYHDDGRSIRLQYTAYPYTDEEGTVHDALTDTTSPAATLFHAQTDGRLFMGKPITQIREDNGLVSFLFSDTPDAIVPVSSDATPVAIYDLQGNLLPPSTLHLPPLNNSSPRIYIVRFSDGTTKKVFR